MTKPTELYACLYAKEFPAQALLRLRPEMRECACAIMEGEPPLQNVCSMTRKARSLGIARGMTQVEVDTFDDVTALPRSLREELAAKAVLEQLVLRATARVFALASVSITLTLEGGTTHSRCVRPALPTNDRQLWIKLLHLDLEAHPPQAVIMAVALQAEPGSTSKVQLGLFSPQMPEPARLDVTLARIRAIVGEHNVGCAVLRDTHEPDSFRIEPFHLPSGQSSAMKPAALRPAMRKLRPQEPIFVRIASERPAAFVFRELRYAVEEAYGPWVMASEWWSQSLWKCEQWDLAARSQDGSMLCCCLIRDLLRNQWQMAALYD